VKLVDFGVAKMTELDHAEGSGGRKLTRTGMIFGTPEYMSPEQANGQPLDHRVDVYALGIILYETLTGSVPFEGESFMAVLSKHAVQTVPPLREMWPGLSVSPELEAVVMCALTKSREQRYPHMRAFAEALEAVPELPDTIPRDSHVPVRTSTPGSLVAPVRALTPQSQASESVASTAPEPSLTPLSTETSLSPQDVPVELAASKPRIPKLSHQRVYASLAAAVLVVGAFVSALVLARPDRDERAATSASSAPAPVAAAPEPAAAPVQIAAPAPPAAPDELRAAPAQAAAEAVPELITLHVSTRPSGAKLSLVGGAQVCAATPCEVEVVRGASVSFLARRGKQRAMTTLEPRDGAQVLLVLDNVKTEAPVEEREQLKADVAAADDDLKVPAAFK
jgi:serine/threonine-protein kinase